jgi:lipid A 3-O-deacylase
MRAKPFLIASVCLLILAVEATAQVKNGWTFYWENDMLHETDRYYTNGIRHQLDFPNDFTPVGLRSSILSDAFDRLLAKFGCPEQSDCFSFSRSLGQNLYSPNTIRSSRLLPGQRPYGAWLYYGGILTLKSPDTQHSLEMDIGVVGPWAGGEAVQTGWHRLLRAFSGEETPVDPQGWDNQISNQPGLQALYRVKHRLLQAQTDRMGRFFDLIPEGGLALGSVYIHPHAGATVRLGFNLSNDLGVDRIPAAFASPEERPLEIYAFGRAEGRYVLYNVFLDGHIDDFGSGRSVDREPLVDEYSYGLAVRWKDVTVSVTSVSRSEEFERQLGRQDFHSLRINVRPRLKD